MITVKQYIEQQNETEWDLENPHLVNLQDNEIVLIDDEPYIKTKVIFLGSENSSKIAKIEELEIENMRLQLELEYLRLENEKIFLRNDALQNLVYIQQRQVEIKKERKRKIQDNGEMRIKMKKLREEKDELSKQVINLNKKITELLKNTVNAIISNSATK